MVTRGVAEVNDGFGVRWLASAVERTAKRQHAGALQSHYDARRRMLAFAAGQGA